MDLMDMLKGAMDEKFIGQLSEKIGEDPKQTEEGMESAFAAILGGLTRNVAQPEGANALLSVLDRDHDGSIFNDLTGFVLGDKKPENPSMLNGSGILNHVLGGNAGNIIESISKHTGMDQSKILQLLISAAPMVLGMLGKMKNQGQTQESQGTAEGAQSSSQGGILDLILNSSRKAEAQNENHSILGKLLDRNGDGSIMDDILKGGTSILGGLFKK